MDSSSAMTLIMYILRSISGADPGLQVKGGGAHLKKLRRAEGGAKMFGVFRVKNHDFTPKNHIFSNFREGGGGGGAPGVPSPGSAPGTSIQKLINIDLRKLVEILVLILKKK